MMNSRFVASRRPVRDRVATRAGARAAAKDHAARTPFDTFKDPLWMLAIAMGVFFVLMAVFTTVG